MTMILKNPNLRTKKLLNVILEKLSQKAQKPKRAAKKPTRNFPVVFFEGQPYVAINGKYLQACLECAEKTVIAHLNWLRDNGVILSKSLADDQYDRTSYYAINPTVLNAANLTVPRPGKKKAFFSAPILTKLQQHISNIINLNKSIARARETNDEEIKNASKEEKILPNLEKLSPESAPQSPVGLLNKNDSKNNTAGEMWRIARETLDVPDAMTSNLAKWLNAALRDKFRSIDGWKDFLNAVKNSAYLMKKGFRLCLRWLLKFRIIDRILKGDFGVSWPERRIPEKEMEARALCHLNVVRECAECREIRKRVLREHGAASYLSWMTHVALIKQDGVIVVSGWPFIAEQVKMRFLRDFPNCAEESRFLENYDKCDKFEVKSA